jgi:hypothetical protein
MVTTLERPTERGKDPVPKDESFRTGTVLKNRHVSLLWLPARPVHSLNAPLATKNQHFTPEPEHSTPKVRLPCVFLIP